jgi:putative DNA primase/helicase
VTDTFDTTKPITEPQVLPCSWDDTGNGERVMHQYGGRLRYLSDEGTWMVYVDRQWKRDKSGKHVQRLVRDVLKNMVEREGPNYSDEAAYNEKGEQIAPSQREKFEQWAKKQQSAMAMKNAVYEAVGYACDATMDDFDQDQRYLNLDNGVLDLETCELLPHNAKFMCTKIAKVSYDPTATAPLFEKCLEQWLPDTAYREYLLRALAYSITGTPDQRALFFLVGPPGTGKSRVVELIKGLLGDYSGSFEGGLIRKKREGTISNALHDVRGFRFIGGSEANKGVELDADLLKQISGYEYVRARALRQNTEEFLPICALWLSSNYFPYVGDDEALWERIKIIPFEVQFQGGARDRTLPGKLAKEASGVLNILLEALKRLREDENLELSEPPAMDEHKGRYKLYQNSAARFLDEYLRDKRLVREGRMRKSSLWALYQVWWMTDSGEAQGGRTYGRNAFYQWMGSPNGGKLTEGSTDGYDEFVGISAR